MAYGIILAVHVVICLLLVLLVLIQSDKGGGLAGAFGGMGGGMTNVFGGQGTANVLTKATTWFAIGFMVIVIGLNLLVAHRGTQSKRSMMQKRADKLSKTAPASALPSNIPDPTQAPTTAAPIQPAPKSTE